MRLLECNVVLCDSIHLESNDKPFLMGIYPIGPHAIDPGVPVSFVIWFQYILPDKWRGVIFFRLIEGDNVLTKDSSDLSDVIFDAGVIHFPPMLVDATADRTLQFQYALSGPDGNHGEWQTAKIVRVGPV